MDNQKVNFMNLHVRTLSREDFDIVSELDNMTEDCFILAPAIRDYEPDESTFAWGLFHNDKLIGYCTVGGADEMYEDDDENIYPGWNTDCLLLSTVFIMPEYRGLDIGTYFIQNVLSKHEDVPGNLVFLDIEDYDISTFYKKLGFKFVDANDENCNKGKVIWTMVKHC